MPLPTLILHVHPRPAQSRVTRELLQALQDLPAVSVRSLYALYPDFDIDVAAEQQALREASLVVWLAPVHWYGLPALFKHWVDQVLLHGWAYGAGGDALHGKTVWWVASAGAPESDYQAGGAHQRPFADFVPPVEQIARFCGMGWLPPFVVHGGHATTAVRRAQDASALAELFSEHRAALSGEST